MLDFCVSVGWGRVWQAAALGLAATALYAVVLSTGLGLEIARRRTYWTVIGGHVIMAGTLAVVSVELGVLFLGWSCVCGLPMVIRSLVREWQQEVERTEAARAAVRGYRNVLDRGADGDPGDDSGNRDRYGSGGAGALRVG